MADEVKAQGTQGDEDDLEVLRERLKDANDTISQREASLKHLREQQFAATAAPAPAPAQPVYATDQTQYGGVTGQDYSDPQIAQTLQYQAQELQRLRSESGLNRFRIENPDHEEYESDILARAQDPATAHLYKVTDVTGNVDYYQTFTQGRMRLENERLRKLQAEHASRAESAATTNNKAKAMATISGDSSVPQAEEVDVNKMTSDEMLDAGYVEMDPDDPVLPRGR